MTENKRFIIIGDENLEFIMQDKLLLPIYDDKERLSLKSCVDVLNKLSDENEQLKQEIKDLRIGVLDSIREADEIKCSCNPCVVEECVKKVVE